MCVQTNEKMLMPQWFCIFIYNFQNVINFIINISFFYKIYIFGANLIEMYKTRSILNVEICNNFHKSFNIFIRTKKTKNSSEQLDY